jgi:hypothetical protein
MGMQNKRKLGVALSVAALAVAGTWAAVGLSGPAGAAVATGQVTAGGSTGPGGTWGPAQPVAGLSALPHTLGATRISAVSCATPGNCAAIGAYDQAVGSGGVSAEPFIVSEADGTWGDAQPVSGVASLGTGSAVLADVSCGAPSDCAAIGWYTGTGGLVHGFVVTETSGGWGKATAIDDSVLGDGMETRLTSLSCPAAGECAAVGFYNSQIQTPEGYENPGPDHAFVIDESAGTGGAPQWGAPQPVPGLASLQPAGDQSGLQSVSCAAAGYCTAVGDYNDAQGFAPYLVTEVRGTWGNATPVPGFSALASPGNQVNGGLDSISCPEATVCTAVGTYGVQGGGSALDVFTVDEADGNWGQAQELSTPGPLNQDYVTPQPFLSCASAGNCAITSTFTKYPSGDPEVFATSESGDGNWGNDQPISGIPAGDISAASTVSCAPGGDCTVVGSYASPYEGGRPSETHLFTATGTPGGSFGSARPLLSFNSPGFLSTVADCPQAGYCTLAVNPWAGVPELVTEATAATVTLKATRPAVTFGAEQAETLTATVASPAGGTPTGTVTVTHGTTPVCTIKLANRTGRCTLTADRLPGGTDKLTATYSGDASYLRASSTATVTVDKARTSTRLTLAKTTITYGHENAEKLTVSVSHVGSVYATGKVTIKAGRVTICTITLSRGGGSCTLSAKRLNPGTYRLAASYPGNSNYLSSNSSLETLRVAR